MQTVHIPGSEGQQISVQISNGFSAPRLFVNGQPAPPGPKPGQYLLRRNDGTEMIAYFKGAFPDPIPVLMVDETSHRLVEPLTWYQWIWAGVPLILIFLGGAIGGLLGGAATTINAYLFRAPYSSVIRYILVALVSLTTFVLWMVIGTLIHR